MKDVGSQATPEVIETWTEVYQLFQSLRGERAERLQQVADQLGITFKVARRRLRNYEAMERMGNAGAPRAKSAPSVERSTISVKTLAGGVRIVKKSPPGEDS